MQNSESDITKVNQEILDYLQENPNAADSLKGVINWWLPQAYKKLDAASIEQVLEQLIGEGLVSKIELTDGTIIYRQRNE